MRFNTLRLWEWDPRVCVVSQCPWPLYIIRQDIFIPRSIWPRAHIFRVVTRFKHAMRWWSHGNGVEIEVFLRQPPAFRNCPKISAKFLKTRCIFPKVIANNRGKLNDSKYLLYFGFLTYCRSEILPSKNVDFCLSGCWMEAGAGEKLLVKVTLFASEADLKAIFHLLNETNANTHPTRHSVPVLSPTPAFDLGCPLDSLVIWGWEVHENIRFTLAYFHVDFLWQGFVWTRRRRA